MGSDGHYAEEAPAHQVAVDGFWMDRSAVTNAEFRRFVDETGYVTLAEQPPDPERLSRHAARQAGRRLQCLRQTQAAGRHARCLQLVAVGAGSELASPTVDRSRRSRIVPTIPSSTSPGEDVEAYAAWAGKELPTEAEWEYAARGGLEGAEYAWGDELTPDGRYLANWWQGNFPLENQQLDGHEYTAPVRSFPPNGYGLFQMTGNVWEWTSDWYQDHAAAADNPCCTIDNPRGGAREASHDPASQHRRRARSSRGDRTSARTTTAGATAPPHTWRRPSTHPPPIWASAVSSARLPRGGELCIPDVLQGGNRGATSADTKWVGDLRGDHRRHRVCLQHPERHRGHRRGRPDRADQRGPLRHRHHGMGVVLAHHRRAAARNGLAHLPAVHRWDRCWVCSGPSSWRR